MNFLDLRKNLKNALLAQIWHSESSLWRHCGSGDDGGTWQVRRKGRSPVTRSFRWKSDALVWARERELEADPGHPQVHKTLRGITVADIVVRYRDEVVQRKRGADRETFVLNAFLRHPLARVALNNFTAGMVSAYCDERLSDVKPGTKP